MWSLLLLSTSFAADLHVSATVPTEVWIEGQPAAKLYLPGSLTVALPDDVEVVPLKVFVGGTPTVLQLPHPGEGGTALVVVGKHGVSLPGEVPDAAPMVASGEVAVQLQVTGLEPLRVQLDDERKRLQPGTRWEIGLPSGEHRLIISSGDGLVRWAAGTLEITGSQLATPLVLQVSEGKLPELHGDGGTYWPDQG